MTKMIRVGLLLSLLCGASVWAGEPKVVDSVAAVVDGRPASWLRVYWEAEVFQRWQAAPGHSPLLDYMAGQTVRQGLVNRWLFLAGSAPVEPNSDAANELEAMVDFFRNTFGTEEDLELFLGRHGRTIEDLRDLFAEVVRVDARLHDRLGPGIRITDADVRKRYDELYGALPESERPAYERSAGLLRAQLEERQFGQRVRLATAQIRNEVAIVVLPNPSDLPEPKLADEP